MVEGVYNWVWNHGFCNFLNFASLIFLSVVQDCSLGQYLKSSRTENSKEKFMVQMGAEVIFSVLMLLCFQSNLLVSSKIMQKMRQGDLDFFLFF